MMLLPPKVTKCQRVQSMDEGEEPESAMVPVVILAIIVALAALVFVLKPTRWVTTAPAFPQCSTACRAYLVESRPENLTYPEGSPLLPSTYSGWLSIIDNSQHTIQIASMYWTLTNATFADPTDVNGSNIYAALIRAAKERNVIVQIVASPNSTSFNNFELQNLVDKGVAEVRYVDFRNMTGAGILHTKFILADTQDFYMGSANMDWRSLTQIQELGIVTTNCSCLANDLSKIFAAYWLVGETRQIPSPWPDSYNTFINRSHPLSVPFEEPAASATVYFSSSPPVMCPSHRTHDDVAIVDRIDAAKEFVYVAVMDYVPVSEFSSPKKFWPVIDNALKRAAFERGVTVRLMASQWNHTLPAMYGYLRSLQEFERKRIQVKLFRVPDLNVTGTGRRPIPFTRVNHNKYMVTDSTAYIGTSNWGADYFLNTAGIGYVIQQPTSADQNGTAANGTLRDQLQAVFERDWNSEYSSDLPAY